MTKTKFEVMDICNKQDIPVGPILSMKAVSYTHLPPASAWR